MSAKPPGTVRTKHGVYQWNHQMDYYKNGILHYYRVDKEQAIIEDENARAAQAVQIYWPTFKTWGMSAKQIRDFADAWDEQVDLRCIDELEATNGSEE